MVTAVVLDGADIVQLLKPEQAKTFNEYTDKDFIPSLLSQLRNGTRLDLVWDRCIADNLKGAARAKHGKGVRRRVVEHASVPRNWQNFLCVVRTR